MMACYFPWRFEGAEGTRPFSCGFCHGCKLERSRQWGVRCMHEASLYDANCFITLTYKETCFSLVYSDFQLFMKRLRARSRARIRFYMAGEYGNGEKGFGCSRPHFHACLFNFDFPDKVYLFTSESGSKVYRSAMLEDLWPHGFSSVGAVTFESAAYVARYCMKKLSGDEGPDREILGILDPDTGEIFERVKEFARMSLGGRGKLGGIGSGFFLKFRDDMYPHGRVVVNGKEVRTPRYYDKKFRAVDAGGYMKLCYARAEESARAFSETAPGRLRAREAVSKARLRKGKL